MASQIRVKRSNVAGKKPTTSHIAAGELAINLADKRLYSSDGTEIFEIGAFANSLSVDSLSVGSGGFSFADNQASLPTTAPETNQVLVSGTNGEFEYKSISDLSGETQKFICSFPSQSNIDLSAAYQNLLKLDRDNIFTNTLNVSIQNGSNSKDKLVFNEGGTYLFTAQIYFNQILNYNDATIVGFFEFYRAGVVFPSLDGTGVLLLDVDGGGFGVPNNNESFWKHSMIVDIEPNDELEIKFREHINRNTRYEVGGGPYSFSDASYISIIKIPGSIAQVGENTASWATANNTNIIPNDKLPDSAHWTNNEVGDIAFSNPPSNLSETEKAAVRDAISAAEPGGPPSVYAPVYSNAITLPSSIAENTLSLSTADYTTISNLPSGITTNPDGTRWYFPIHFILSGSVYNHAIANPIPTYQYGLARIEYSSNASESHRVYAPTTDRYWREVSTLGEPGPWRELSPNPLEWLFLDNFSANGAAGKQVNFDLRDYNDIRIVGTLLSGWAGPNNNEITAESIIAADAIPVASPIDASFTHKNSLSLRIHDSGLGITKSKTNPDEFTGNRTFEIRLRFARGTSATSETQVARIDFSQPSNGGQIYFFSIYGR